MDMKKINEKGPRALKRKTILPNSLIKSTKLEIKRESYDKHQWNSENNQISMYINNIFNAYFIKLGNIKVMNKL